MENTLKELLKEVKKLNVMHKDVFTTDEVAIYLNCTSDYVKQLTSKKKIPYYKTGGKNYYSCRELEKWALSGEHVEVEKR